MMVEYYIPSIICNLVNICIITFGLITILYHFIVLLGPTSSKYHQIIAIIAIYVPHIIT